MVQLTCNQCGGHSFIKNGKYFVCQSCGTYNTEESLLNLLLGESEMAAAESRQLDYEIRLLEEYKPYYDELCNKKNRLNSSEGFWDSCLLGCFYGFLVWIVLGIMFKFSGVVFCYASIICSGWVYIKNKEHESEAKKNLEIANQNYQSKYAELKENIKLIPERFWTNGDVVRDYYQNWGATNQKDLLAHLAEHYRKPDVITRTVPVYVPKKG